jgi:hypothetical protein
VPTFPKAVIERVHRNANKEQPLDQDQSNTTASPSPQALLRMNAKSWFNIKNQRRFKMIRDVRRDSVVSRTSR